MTPFTNFNTSNLPIELVDRIDKDNPKGWFNRSVVFHSKTLIEIRWSDTSIALEHLMKTCKYKVKYSEVKKAFVKEARKLAEQELKHREKVRREAEIEDIIKGLLNG